MFEEINKRKTVRETVSGTYENLSAEIRERTRKAREHMSGSLRNAVNSVYEQCKNVITEPGETIKTMASYVRRKRHEHRHSDNTLKLNEYPQYPERGEESVENTPDSDILNLRGEGAGGLEEIIRQTFPINETPRLRDLEGLTHSQIATKLMEWGHRAIVTEYLDKFNDLDCAVLGKIIDAGFTAEVRKNHESFDEKEIEKAVKNPEESFAFTDHSEIAGKLIDAGFGEQVAGNLDSYRRLSADILKKLAKKFGPKVAEHPDSFSIGHHQYIVDGLITAGLMGKLTVNKKNMQAVADNLGRYENLAEDFLPKLIENGFGAQAAKAPESFEIPVEKVIREIVDSDTVGVSGTLYEYLSDNPEERKKIKQETLDKIVVTWFAEAANMLTLKEKKAVEDAMKGERIKPEDSIETIGEKLIEMNILVDFEKAKTYIQAKRAYGTEWRKKAEMVGQNPEGPEEKKEKPQPEEGEELSGKEKERLVTSAKSFPELYEAIRKIGHIPILNYAADLKKAPTYEPEELIKLIESYRKLGDTEHSIPETYGIHDAVKRIMKLPDDGEEEGEDRIFQPRDILKLSKEDRKRALAEYKERIVQQRKAIGQCRLEIEKSIESDNNMSKEKLMTITEQYAEKHSFSPEQKKIIDDIINEYCAMHERVREMRKRFPNNTDLVNELTGEKFSGDRFKVSVGPMSIDIEASEEDTKKLFKREDLLQNFSLGGFAGCYEYGERKIYYTVINKDSGGSLSKFLNQNEKEKKKISDHEFEHHKNRIFESIFQKHFDTEYHTRQFGRNTWGYAPDRSTDPKERKENVKKWFKNEQKYAFNRVKDEIFAMLRDHSLSNIQRNLSYNFFKQDNTLYDYLAEKRKMVEKKSKNNPELKNLSEKYFVKEYKKVIETSFRSFRDMIKKGKYSTEEAVALLTDTPLQDWPKVVRRILTVPDQEKRADRERKPDEENEKRAMEALLSFENSLVRARIQVREKSKGFGDRMVKGWRWCGDMNLLRLVDSKVKNKVLRFGLRTVSIRTIATAGLLATGFAGGAIGVAATAGMAAARGAGAGIGTYDIAKGFTMRGMKKEAREVPDSADITALLAVKKKFEEHARFHVDESVLKTSEYIKIQERYAREIEKTLTEEIEEGEQKRDGKDKRICDLLKQGYQKEIVGGKTVEQSHKRNIKWAYGGGAAVMMLGGGLARYTPEVWDFFSAKVTGAAETAEEMYRNTVTGTAGAIERGTGALAETYQNTVTETADTMKEIFRSVEPEVMAQEMPEYYWVRTNDSVRGIISKMTPEGNPVNPTYILEELRKLPPEQLKEMGMSSGDVSKVLMGDKINVPKLREFIEQVSGEGVAGVENMAETQTVEGDVDYILNRLKELNPEELRENGIVSGDLENMGEIDRQKLERFIGSMSSGEHTNNIPNVEELAEMLQNQTGENTPDVAQQNVSEPKPAPEVPETVETAEIEAEIPPDTVIKIGDRVTDITMEELAEMRPEILENEAFPFRHEEGKILIDNTELGNPKTEFYTSMENMDSNAVKNFLVNKTGDERKNAIAKIVDILTIDKVPSNVDAFNGLKAELTEELNTKAEENGIESIYRFFEGNARLVYIHRDDDRVILSMQAYIENSKPVDFIEKERDIG